MMYATLCDCQQLAAMMDKNPDLPSKRDFVTVCNLQLLFNNLPSLILILKFVFHFF